MPACPVAGVQLNVAAPVPAGVAGVRVAPLGRFALGEGQAPPSGSLAVIAIVSVCPMVTVRLPIGLGLTPAAG